ncbi:hypothetical protein M0R04_00535 [Candidatus Dojkabacteria bacterium]|jgi:hypothetical protein|nr:hypothetical protein [Candidatus Dojkabacteria bacterium]
MEIDTSIIITIGTLIFLLLLFILAFKNSGKVSKDERLKIYKQLDDIKFSMTLNSSAGNRDGFVRLDALLSKALQIRYKNSDLCGDNLKRCKNLFSKKFYEKMWYYHKLRNQIVHENIEINDKDAVNGYSVYSEVIIKLLK